MPPPHHTTTVDLHPLVGRRRPTTEALHAVAQAERKRAVGDDLQRLGDATGARWEHREAQQLEAAARAVLEPTEIARPSSMAEKWRCMTTLTRTTATPACTCSTPSATRTWPKRRRQPGAAQAAHGDWLCRT